MKRLYSKPTGKCRSDPAVDVLLDYVRAEEESELQALGNELYGERWPAVLAHNAQRMTGGVERELTFTEKAKLVDGLKRLKARR